MMTVVRLGRIGNWGCDDFFPRWAAEWIFHTAGSATPGRGGRRKRRRAQVVRRRPGNPEIDKTCSRAARLQFSADLVSTFGFNGPGYCERRRLAKLRRRRASADDRERHIEWCAMAKRGAFL
jgi:hypothetical protein